MIVSDFNICLNKIALTEKYILGPHIIGQILDGKFKQEYIEKLKSGTELHYKREGIRKLINIKINN